MITVAVGSKNPSKVRAVEVAFRLIGIRVRVVPLEPPRGLPPEPVGIDEILNGAVERANYALSNVPNAEFGVGIEAGLLRLGRVNSYIDLTMAAVVDRRGIATIGLSPGFMVPSKFVSEVLSGKELSEVAERYYKIPGVGKVYGLIGILTRRFIERLDLNTEAVYMALIPRAPWNRDVYGLDK